MHNHLTRRPTPIPNLRNWCCYYFALIFLREFSYYISNIRYIKLSQAKFCWCKCPIPGYFWIIWCSLNSSIDCMLSQPQFLFHQIYMPVSISISVCLFSMISELNSVQPMSWTICWWNMIMKFWKWKSIENWSTIPSVSVGCTWKLKLK